jgi:hypothetical protein
MHTIIWPGVIGGTRRSELFFNLLVAAAAVPFFPLQKIIFCDGFNDQELSNYKSILQHNLCLGLKELLQRLDEAGVEFNKKIKKVRVRTWSFFSRSLPFLYPSGG